MKSGFSVAQVAQSRPDESEDDLRCNRKLLLNRGRRRAPTRARATTVLAQSGNIQQARRRNVTLKKKFSVTQSNITTIDSGDLGMENVV